MLPKSREIRPGMDPRLKPLVVKEVKTRPRNVQTAILVSDKEKFIQEINTMPMLLVPNTYNIQTRFEHKAVAIGPQIEGKSDQKWTEGYTLVSDNDKYWSRNEPRL